jgi:hypothetical protein
MAEGHNQRDPECNQVLILNQGTRARLHRIQIHQEGIQHNPRIVQHLILGTPAGRMPPNMLATSNHRYSQEGGEARLWCTQGILPYLSAQLPRENLRNDHGN